MYEYPCIHNNFIHESSKTITTIDNLLVYLINSSQLELVHGTSKDEVLLTYHCNFQAFGVGALEEEDADIYSTDHLSNYDMTMDIGEKDSNFGWTAPGKHKPSKHFLSSALV